MVPVRNNGDLVAIRILNIVDVLLQFFNADDSHFLMLFVACLEVVHDKNKVNIVLSQLIGNIPFPIPGKSDFGSIPLIG